MSTAPLLGCWLKKQQVIYSIDGAFISYEGGKTLTEKQVTGLYRSIHGQPQAVRALLADWDGPEQAAEKPARARRIFVAGTGPSFHAATAGE